MIRTWEKKEKGSLWKAQPNLSSSAYKSIRKNFQLITVAGHRNLEAFPLKLCWNPCSEALDFTRFMWIFLYNSHALSLRHEYCFIFFWHFIGKSYLKLHEESLLLIVHSHQVVKKRKKVARGLNNWHRVSDTLDSSFHYKTFFTLHIYFNKFLLKWENWDFCWLNEKVKSTFRSKSTIRNKIFFSTLISSWNVKIKERNVKFIHDSKRKQTETKRNRAKHFERSNKKAASSYGVVTVWFFPRLSPPDSHGDNKNHFSIYIREFSITVNCSAGNLQEIFVSIWRSANDSHLSANIVSQVCGKCYCQIDSSDRLLD